MSPVPFNSQDKCVRHEDFCMNVCSASFACNGERHFACWQCGDAGGGGGGDGKL